MRIWRAPGWVPVVGSALGAWVAMAPALAQRGPSLVVLPFQSAQSELSALVTQRVTELVVQELRQAGQVLLLDPGTVRAPTAAAPAAPPALGEAERLYEEGRTRVQKQEFEEAAQALSRAIQVLEQHLAAASDYGFIADLQLWHGIAHFRAGNEAEGKIALQRALVVRPDLQLDPNRYPPLFRRIVDQVRTSIRSGPRGTLRVSTVPAGCEVTVNGVLRGRSPAELSDLPVGRHYVRVSCPGYEPQAAVRDVAAAGAAELSFALTAAPGGGPTRDPVSPLLARLRQGLVDGDTVSRIHEVALRSLADYALVGYFVKGGGDYNLRAYLFRAPDGRMTPLPATRFDPELLSAADEAKRIARAVEKALVAFPVAGAEAVGDSGRAGDRREIRTAGDLARAEALLQREELERLAREERERRLAPLGGDVGGGVAKPFYKRWWFWTIVGAVVVGGVTGAVGAAAGGSGSANIGVRWAPP